MSGRIQAWLGAALLLAVAAVTQLLPRPTNNILFALLRAGCDLFALLVIGRRPLRTEPGRRAWVLLQVGLVLFLAGDLLAAVAFLRPQALPVPEWASGMLLHLLPIPVFIGAVLAWPEEGGGPDPCPRLHAVLDGVLFGYAAYFLIWVLGIRLWEGATRASMSSGSLIARFAMLGLLLGACVYQGSRRPTRWQGPLLPLGAAFLLLTLSSAFSAASLLGRLGPGYRVVGGVMKIGALLLIARAAWGDAPGGEGWERPGRRGLGRALHDLLPYIPAALATAAAFLAGFLHEAPLDRRILLLAAPMVGLLLVRQGLAYRDLRRFSEGLETQVEERTRALEAAQAVAMRTERMNAVAMLGAGLAHDMKNALSSIRSYSELISEEVRAGQMPDPKDLDRILVASDQAAVLSNRLMAFGREEVHEEVLDLQAELVRIEDLLRMLVPRRIVLRFSLGQGFLPVRAARSHLEQILVNLVSNARDAIAGEGGIAIRLTRGDGPEGPEAVVEVQDTGSGMPPEVQARLFEPFFTTKAPGRGTGLGLSSVRALVLKEGGRIELTTLQGQGTTFTLRFPLAAAHDSQISLEPQGLS